MRPTEQDIEDLDILTSRDDITKWEEDFLTSLEEREVWTDKQCEKFDEIREAKGLV